MDHLFAIWNIQPLSYETLRAVAGLLVVAAAEALIALILVRRKTVMKTVMAALSLLTAVAALALCLFWPGSDTLDPLPAPELHAQGDPYDTVSAFFEAVSAGDWQAADACLPEGESLAALLGTDSEELSTLRSVLAENRAWRLRGGSVIEGLEARQSVSLSGLDLGALQPELDSAAEAELTALCRQRARRDLADENGAYWPELRREVWEEKLSALLEHPEDYAASAELELRLRYRPDGWHMENTGELLRALSGFLPEEDADLGAWAARSLEQATGSLVYTRTVYTVPEDAEAGPAFDETKYIHTYDPMVVQEVVDSAAALLDGQELCWNASIQRMEGSEMICYCDETILVICWKEIVNDCCLSFCEVKIAHPSQLRRALAGGSYCYGAGPRIVETRFAKSVNAVASINGDFYDYRQLGITVYRRQLYRNNPLLVDSCFFTSSGDMIFSHRGELCGEGEAQQFIEDNDVIFSLAFGPILVEDYEATTTWSYPVGEVLLHYSRSAIGQLDSLHYLLMTCGFGDWYANIPDINETARYIQAKGVEKAYTLDGGQTAEIYVDGRAYNHIDFDTERPMSDIIYFVTALPEESPG